LSTAWQKASFTYTPAAPGRSTLDVDAYVSGAAPGTCFMADDVSLTFAPTPAAPPAQPPPDPGLVDNAGFEADLAGWNTSGSAPGISLARVAGGHSGDRAASVDNSATTAGTCALNDAPNIVATTAPGRYTAALWVRAETAGKTLRLRLREYDKTTRSLLGGQSMPVELTTSWQKVTVSYVPSAPGASALDLNAYVTDAASGNCFVADDAAVSLGPVDPEPDLVPNPGFEPGLWRWNTSGSAARRHRVARAGRTLRRLDSQAGQHCDNRGNLRAQRRAQRREHHGERHLHHTMWVRAATAGPTLKLKVREYQGTTLVGSDTTPISLTTAWQQVAVTHTPIAPGNSTLDLTAYISGAAPGTCFLVDDISIRHS
jgi:hypothetical protein